MSKKQKYSDQELWNIVSANKERFTSVRTWNEYAEENNLPHAQTFITRLGSWNEIKGRYNLKKNKQHRSTTYTKNELISILEKYRSEYLTINKWNQFASKNDLPTHNVFERHVGLDEIEQITGYKPRLDSEDIKDIILCYFPSKPPTVKEWNELRENVSVPSSSTIIKEFNTWNEMKKYVYN